MNESKKYYYRIIKTIHHNSEPGLKYVVQRKRKRGIFKYWFNTRISLNHVVGWDTIEESRMDRDDRIDIDNGVYRDIWKDDVME